MKILRSDQIKEVDQYTMENEPILSLNLMERAATRCSEWILEEMYYKEGVHVFVGPGNNGGDGLAVSRHLAEAGMSVYVYLVRITDKLSGDAEVNLGRLRKLQGVELTNIEEAKALPDIPGGHLIVDALFGSGLNRPLKGLPAAVVKHLNGQPAARLSIDIPSGLFGQDNGKNNPEAIFRADHTLTFQFPKLSFFFPEHEDMVGNWHVLNIGLMQEKIDQVESPYYLVTRHQMRDYLKPRKRFAHKGHFGHVLLITGGYGKMGAAVLASRATLRTGSGLVTTHIPRLGYEILQTALPEAMVSLDISDIIFSQPPDLDSFACVGAGPGLGTKENTQKALGTLIERGHRPLVLDADALNILSMNQGLLDKLPAGSILTPHPREFERLTHAVENHHERLELQRDFAIRHKVVLVLKGGNTSIAMPDGRLYFNTTGNPGMATGGSGDVLTGMIASLVGQGYPPERAAILGVWLHGHAGDWAGESRGPQALIASDIVESIGLAFKSLQDEQE
ncbi:MAG: NAD(P)H-hydrate dehydratase [Bacteroidales bacterium]|nr:NAD(P)H-hydrate dehydratase [Bacteroidales bacterium]